MFPVTRNVQSACVIELTGGTEWRLAVQTVAVFVLVTSAQTGQLYIRRLYLPSNREERKIPIANESLGQASELLAKFPFMFCQASLVRVNQSYYSYKK